VSITLFNPEQWLETMVRGIKDYTLDGLHKSIVDDGNNYVGEEVYEVVMEFPSTDMIARKVPFVKTLIHFEIDDVEDRIMGFGENVFRENYDPLLFQISPQEGREHRVNFDVGIWSSDRSGGTTSRLRAYQVISNLFLGGLAVEKLRTATTAYDPVDSKPDSAIDILDFSGGRFITDTVNDVTIYRMIDCMLTTRCYSRTPLDPIQPTIEDVDQIQVINIDDHLIP